MKLKEICEINPRMQGIDDSLEVSFVPMSSVSEDGKIDVSDIRSYGDVKKGYTSFRERDVLFAKITPCMENGKGAVAQGLKNGIGCGSSEFHILRPMEELAKSEWIYYMTAWDRFRKEAAKHMTGSAGQRRVPKSYLENYELKLPSIRDQEYQINVLSRLQTIIDSQKKELEILDQLVKARFVEMFGHIKTNNKNWKRVPMKCLVDIRGRVGWKGYKKEDLRESGPLVLGATHLTDCGDLDLTSPVYLSREKYEESPEIVLQKNDLIFTQRGNTIGKVGLVEQEIGEATINPCVLILRPTKVDPIYLKRYFVMDETKDDMWLLNSGSAQPMITQKGIGDYYLMLPPENLQKQFAEFVKRVDKSKVTVQNALAKSQYLFDSLIQKYFG